MASGSFLYFAYGSNLLKQRLTLNNPSAEFVSIGKLKGYTLVFGCGKGMDPYFSRWKGGAATIKECKNSHVWGSVWRLSVKDRANLDRQESIYNAIDITVTSPDNQELSSLTYQMEQPEKVDYDTRPSPQYKDVILRGAKELGLPEDYLKKLESIEDNGYEGDLEIYNEVLKSINGQG